VTSRLKLINGFLKGRIIPYNGLVRIDIGLFAHYFYNTHKPKNQQL